MRVGSQPEANVTLKGKTVRIGKVSGHLNFSPAYSHQSERSFWKYVRFASLIAAAGICKTTKNILCRLQKQLTMGLPISLNNAPNNIGTHSIFTMTGRTDETMPFNLSIAKKLQGLE